MKKILYILFFLHLILTPFYAQPSITWQRFYEGGLNQDDYCYDICKTIDGNLVLGGNTFFNGATVLKINLYGDSIWLKHFTGSFGQAITATYDGGCLLASPTFLKINASGDSLWFKNYSGNGIINLYDVKECTDYGFITCGRAYYDSGYVMKTDVNGNILWSNLYSDTLLAVRLYAIEEMNNDGFIATGYAFNLNDFELVVVRMGVNGERRWFKKYSEGYLIGRGIKIIIQQPYYLIIGIKGYLKINDSGNVIDTSIIPLSNNESISDFLVIPNDRMVAVTNIAVIPTLTTKLRLMDSMGNTLFLKNLNFSEYVDLHNIIQLPNGDFIFSGAAEHDSLESDFYAIRSDSNLNFPPIGVENVSKEVPERFHLFQNYPNPFNPTTKIKYAIPLLRGVSEGRGVLVRLIIYDILGREIAVLVNQLLTPGTYEVEFDGSNHPSGVYFYRLTAGDYTECKKMVLIK